MTKEQLHDLAVAYAQARLARKSGNAAMAHSENEVSNFYSDYQYACETIVKLLKQNSNS